MLPDENRILRAYYLKPVRGGGFCTISPCCCLWFLMSKYFTRKRNDTRSVIVRVQEDLKNFKKLYYDYHTTFKVRLRILKKYAAKKYIFVPKEDLLRLRKRFNNKRVKTFVSIFDDKGGVRTCDLCELNNTECRHHVIQLQHGGFKGGDNVIFLCNDCHGLIHPWLGYFKSF